jgi:signal peptidase
MMLKVQHPHVQHPHIEAHAHGRRHVLHDVFDAVLLLATIALVWYLWPAALGGNTHFVVVQGHSMEPTFHLGDIIIVRANEHPKVGDIIVYEVPKDEPAAGMMIVHRVKSIRPDGTLETQGDNRKEPDPFQPTAANVMGSPVRAIPHLGRLIGLSTKPVIVGAAAGGLTIFVLWPSKPRQRRRKRVPGPGAALLPDVPDLPVDIDFDAEAERWLQEQLAAAGISY